MRNATSTKNIALVLVLQIAVTNAFRAAIWTGTATSTTTRTTTGAPTEHHQDAFFVRARTTATTTETAYGPLFMALSSVNDEDKKESTSTTTTKQPKGQGQGQRIVVVGGGIGGLSTAYDARHLLRPYDEIVVISDREQFQFTPSNPWVALHKRKPEDISISLTETLPKHKIEFVHGKVKTLHPKMNQLVLENGATICYDYLVIATGPRLGFEEIPGARHVHHHTSSICTTPHAQDAANVFDQLVQNPGPVVVGAAQGASCFGPAYEYVMLLQHELYQLGGSQLVQACPIHFITPEPYIGHLGLKGAGDSERILTSMLEKRKIEYTTNCKVQRVNADSVSIQYIDTNNNNEKVNRIIPSRLTMLIPPFRGMDVWKVVPGLTDDKGMILVDQHQQTKYPNIFAVGICVHIDPLEDTPIPTGVPKTGYMIESMGTAVAKNIRDIIQFHEKQGANESSTETTTMKQLHHVPLLNGLCITDFGAEGAVFVAMPQIPPRRHDVTVTGKIGTIAKVAFEKYFLWKIESGDTDPYYEKYMLGLVGIQRTTKD